MPLLFYLKSKGIIPLLVFIAAASGFVAIIDQTRFLRLTTFWQALFKKTALLSGMTGPPEL
ncbi:MAG: hypothetical protein JXB24_12415 [Bacteroidales bacterium]|nr:hypothetical protein [Bacteroidales bacterium]